MFCIINEKIKMLLCSSDYVYCDNVSKMSILSTLLVVFQCGRYHLITESVVIKDTLVRKLVKEIY